MSPNVTVLMSVFNGKSHVGEAIESILNQTFTDFEFIVIDDSSTDNTLDILQSYATKDPRIILLKNEINMGLTRSLNRGLKIARGKYIARQDADDISLPERLSIQTDFLDRKGNIGLLGTAYYVINNNGEITGLCRQPQTDTEIRWQMLFHNTFCHTSVMFRRELLSEGKYLYDENLRYSQDYDFWAKLLNNTIAANLDTPLVKFRSNEAGISATKTGEQQNTANSIAIRQVKTIDPKFSLSDSQIATLRQWYYNFPEHLDEDGLKLCQILLQLLIAFEKQHDIDHYIAAELKLLWAEKILASASIRQIKFLWSSGLLSSKYHHRLVLIPGVIRQRIKRIISLHN